MVRSEEGFSPPAADYLAFRSGEAQSSDSLLASGTLNGGPQESGKPQAPGTISEYLAPPAGQGGFCVPQKSISPFAWRKLI